MFDAPAMFAEVGGQPVEKFGIGGGIGDAHVVDGFDDASLEEVAPDAIGEGFGEEWVGGISEPIASLALGSMPAARSSLGPSRPAGFITACVLGWVTFPARATKTASVGSPLSLFSNGFVRRARRRRRRSSSRLGSIFRMVVMALRALDAGAEKKLTDVIDVLLRRADLAIPGDGWVFCRRAGGGEDRADELVIGMSRWNASLSQRDIAWVPAV